MADEPETSLVPTDSPGAPDAFEREYMKGEGMVLYRDKMVAGRTMNLILAGTAAFLAATSIGTGSFAGVLLSLPLLAVIWLLFGVLRVTVSEQSVDVKLGLFGPKIPMRSIESVLAMDYKWSSVGGWGIRKAPGGWMYNMPGDGGRAVKIVWRDEAGKKKITYVGTKTATELAAAIKKGFAALPPGKDGPAALRSGDDESDDA